MRRLCLLALLLAGCRADEPPPAATPAAARAGERAAAAPGGPVPDAAHPDGRPPPVVFDTTEPPDAPLAIAPRPLPPRPAAEPAPRPAAPGGSCDVSPAEGFCFAYVGPAWTPAAARAHCADAPGSTFRAAACPTDGRIATCAFARASAPGRDLLYTYYEPADPLLAEMACPGTFERAEE